jgi:Flp pilus assembly protein TadD
MPKIRSKILRTACAAAAVLAGAGCANLAEFTASLEKEWAEPSVEVTPKQTPTDPEAQRLRAEMKVRTLEGLTTATDCAKILEIAPDVLASLTEITDEDIKLARCQYQGLDFASARKTYRGAFDRTGDAEALKGLALTELRDGRIEQGLDLMAGLNTNETQTDWQVFNAIGYASDVSGRFAEARDAYLRAAELSPDQGGALNNLGMSYLRQGNNPGAIDAFRQALDREPGLSVARLNLRIALASSGDFAVALAGASEAEQAAVLNSVGAQALSRGDVDTAKSLFLQALETSPSFYTSAFENLERARMMPSGAGAPGAKLKTTASDLPDDDGPSRPSLKR